MLNRQPLTAYRTPLPGVDYSELQGKLIDGKYHGLAVCCFVEGGAGFCELIAQVLEAIALAQAGCGRGARAG